MKRGIIYLILNKQNEHKYIGNTTLAMNKEWVQHIEKSKRMSSEPLHKAFREYGIHNFMIRELDECDESEFYNKTNYWIEKYQPEYNVIETIIKPVEVKEIKQEEKKPRSYKTSPHLIQWNEENRGNGKHFGFKIRGKNLKTGICTDYESARVAAEQVTGKSINNSNIILAARTGRTAYGHKWQIIEEKDQKRAVFGVNKKTEQIEVRYESISAALREYKATDKQGILRSLKNPGKYTWKGYWWFYVRN
jgi:group I intron endonuclease